MKIKSLAAIFTAGQLVLGGYQLDINPNGPSMITTQTRTFSGNKTWEEINEELYQIGTPEHRESLEKYVNMHPERFIRLNSPGNVNNNQLNSEQSEAN